MDVIGLDPELLAMVPQSTCALLLLFPTSDKVNTMTQARFLENAHSSVLVVKN